MIFLLYCCSISLLCAVPIILLFSKQQLIIQNTLKNHWMLFLLKSVIISMFIYIFISNLSISNTKLFILVGCIVFVLFHFIEGYVLQRILLKDVKRTRNER